MLWFSVFFFLKLAQQMPPRKVNLFDESSPFLKEFMYISLGILAGLLLIGTLWNIFFRMGGGAKQPNTLVEYLTYIVTCNSNHGPGK